MSTPRWPERLWHYTDCSGLFGIVSSQALRFGHVRFLNDATETSFGRDTVRRLVSDPIGLTAILARYPIGVEALFRKIETSTEYFVFSLTEAADTLSQWQRYSSAGRGYAIAFDVHALLDALPGTVRLRPMRYSAEAQRVRLEEVIADDSKNEPNPAQLQRFTAAISELPFEFKNPAFADEKEWRLTCSTFEDVPGHRLLFLPRADITKLYLDMSSLHKDSGILLPIRSVVCGPKLDPRTALDATRRFLWSNGYADVEVEASQLCTVWR